MSLSFRTNGNFIDFVNTDATSLEVETVLMKLHNTSRCIDWSLPEDTTKISFTIDEVKYSNIPISEIDFDGTVMNSQDDFETGITDMFPGLASSSPGGGGWVESVTAGTNGGLLFGGTATNPTIALPYKVYTALLTHTATDSPDDGNEGDGLQNSWGGAFVWARAALGSYTAASPINIDITKCFIPGFGNFEGNACIYIPIGEGASLLGYYNIYPNGNDNKFYVTVVNNLFQPVELSALIGASALPIEFRQY